MIGPPLPGAPWLMRDGWTGLAGFTGQPPPAPGTPGGTPGSAATRNFLPRVPDPKDPNYNRRMARATEHLHSLLNSLIGTGQLQQTGQTDWILNPAAATTGTGLTGTFNAGAF